MADYIYNRAWKSGGKWHLVEGEVTFITIPAGENRHRLFRTDEEGDSVRITPEHQVAQAKVRCGVATGYDGKKGFIKTGHDHRDDWTKAYSRWKKDRTKDMVITEKYAPPLVVLNAEVPPEPFCGNCIRILEAGQ